MKIFPTLALLCSFALLTSFPAFSPAADQPIPDPLKPWEAWALWGESHRDCPHPFNDGKKSSCLWPSTLALQVDPTTGHFEFTVTVFHQSWVPLPGGPATWPLDVQSNQKPLPVTESQGLPAIQLPPGTHRISGNFRWNEVPQRLQLPTAIGILTLSLNGKPVPSPAWDEKGVLWLKRPGSTEDADKTFLNVKLSAALEDGIPLWLRMELELTVSGKSREEDLGSVLPEGWKLASVESPIPVAIDDSGRLKAQVRTGKWKVSLSAFRFDNPQGFSFAKNSRPAVTEMFIAFRARPDFRAVEILGARPVDVSQTTFPDQWRELPVYQWDTASPFKIEVRERGVGKQNPSGLHIDRVWWLDDNGQELTFRDKVQGAMKQLWRLDATAGQNLGSVRSDGQGQLITRNPQGNATGVEIRTQAIDLDATGRMKLSAQLPATGWNNDANSLKVTLHLPPGWRLLALFGADRVDGDWLTAWTLLDLFLLLIFTLAVFRLWNWRLACLAFLAFGLSYHEPRAPHYIWLLLLAPIALLRVVPNGHPRRLLQWCQWITIAAFLLFLLPFLAQQIVQALYPQLEKIGTHAHRPTPFDSSNVKSLEAGEGLPDDASPSGERDEKEGVAGKLPAKKGRQSNSSWGLLSSTRGVNALSISNLSYDTAARIQTGPGIPEWQWRTVQFSWNGPVTASQTVHPLLIPPIAERLLTAARVALILLLASLLLQPQRLGEMIFRKTKAATALLLLLLAGSPLSSASAQSPFPDPALLNQLRDRLLKIPDAFPHAAEIPDVTLTIDGRHVTIDAEIHAAVTTAVPLPGRLPAWSPLSVQVDDQPAPALRRDNDYLWVVLSPGVHRVRVESLLADVTEWEWTFLLPPRHVKINAPAWTFTGVKPNGVPEPQIFFTLKEKAAAASATYDRQDLQTIVGIERHLELGLIWQVRTTVSRLSPTDKAVALRVPLLPGENVLSANAVVKDGWIEVRLGAQEKSFSWESSLTMHPTLKLATRPNDTWVERWQLTASPVWNVTFSGITPTFETSNPNLVPLWQPWPGESVELAIGQPKTIDGATVTVSRGHLTTTLGSRQRTSTLDLTLRCSLGEDFLLELPPNAEVTTLTHSGKPIPLRQEGPKIVIPVRPGEQQITIAWKSPLPLLPQTLGEAVRLPVESANLQTTIQLPDDRWVLWTHGPQRGPAVRFWGILLCSLLAALALGRVTDSPLRTSSWMLLAIGLTQVPLVAALLVIAWLFALTFRGRPPFQNLSPIQYNLLQVSLIGLTFVALGILLFAVHSGLLGTPEMFITGNQSFRTTLRWFQARSGPLLPQPGCLSISIWWYRLAMLGWALWLATSLISWLRSGWQNFTTGGISRPFTSPKPHAEPHPKPHSEPSTQPPPLPTPHSPTTDS